MIWQYEWCNAQLKRERVESQSIKRKQQDVFRGSSTELYVPAFTEKDFQSIRSTELLSQPIQPSPRQYKRSTEDRSTELHQGNWFHLHRGITNTIHLYRRGIQTNTNSTSPRGSKPTPQPLPKREHPTIQINIYQGGIQQMKKGTTLGGFYNHKQFSFSHK